MSQETQPSYLEQQSQLTTPTQEKITPLIETLQQPLSPAARRAVVAEYFNVPPQAFLFDTVPAQTAEVQTP